MLRNNETFHYNRLKWENGSIPSFHDLSTHQNFLKLRKLIKILILYYYCVAFILQMRWKILSNSHISRGHLSIINSLLRMAL